MVSRGFQLSSMGRARAFYNADRGVGCEREGAGPQGNLILGAFLKFIFLLWKLQRKKHDKTGCWQCFSMPACGGKRNHWYLLEIRDFYMNPKRT